MVVPAEVAAIEGAIKLVNRGRGVRAASIVVEEKLANLLAVSHDDDPEIVRKAVVMAWRHGADLMHPDLGRVLLIASGISYAAPQIGARIAYAGTMLDRDPRTVRRRYDEAVHQLASHLLSQAIPTDDSSESGFYVVNFDQIADFTSEVPRFIGHRTIRVTAPEVTEITDRVYLPRLVGQEPTYRCLSGATMTSVSNEFSGIWQFRLQLPRTLHAGELFDFSTSIQVPDRDKIDPFACFIGTRHALRVRIELWLGHNADQATVWELPGIPNLAVGDRTPRPPFLQPDADGRIVRSYQDLVPGFAYGVRWQWNSAPGLELDV